jgi:hypothetical protein
MSVLTRDRRHKDGAFPLRIPQNRPSNSLRHRTLPVSPFAVRTLRVIFFYLHQNKEFRGWGGGGVPTGNSSRLVRPLGVPWLRYDYID